MTRTRWIAAAALGLAVCGALSVRAAESDDGGLDVVKVRKNFYMIAGAGGNIGVQIGSDGVVLVNAGAASASDQVLAALKKLTELPIRYIINVDAGAEFVGGNEKLARAGFTIFTRPIAFSVVEELLPDTDLFEHYCLENERDDSHFPGRTRR